MNSIDLKELKEIELNILKYVDRLCSENCLRYYLCGGTLLGAVRHKGFIPWDDDIDIVMPRPDYDKFLDVLSDDERYAVLSSKNTKGYYYNFAKVIDKTTELIEGDHTPIQDMGVYIDIFPLEGMPNGEAERNDHFNKLYKLKRRINSYSLKPRIRKNVFLLAVRVAECFRNRFVELKKIQEIYESLAKKYNYDETTYVYASGGAYGKKDVFSKQMFANSIQMEFEGEMFCSPIGYKEYLKQLYGDYMQLPPPEKRVSHHVFTARYK